MHFLKSLLFPALLTATLAPAAITPFAASASAASAEAPQITATAETTLINNAGNPIGTASFMQGPRGILISLSVKGLPPGKHGMHFHAVGECAPLDTFKGAHGHIMPGNLPHGFFNADGPHAGNLPNLIVGADGTAEVELYTNLLMLDQGDGKVLDEDGSTLVIHANPDNHFSQPIGGSGGRIACGVITAR
ncbi:superoxide dismutase family protein [Shimia sp. R9_3]|uniref:superoxide dismutase family protein n=1 Tax=Shimia sp. R9_3 TaxID=2821113 RepID=UPI001ADC475F|nr:superoxide dismutase family protein [Shimia sp. R9_3]MBO9403253.1 superoxide dismutase family protein [Shimia sp. R9_3]